MVFPILWINWNERLILPTQFHPLLISIFISFRLQMESAMNQIRLWSMTNMGCSHDCLCFGSKKCSSKYVVFIFPFIPTVYSCLVSWQKCNLSRHTQLILRTLWVIETRYKIFISSYSKNLQHDAGFARLYLGNY